MQDRRAGKNIYYALTDDAGAPRSSPPIIAGERARNCPRPRAIRRRSKLALKKRQDKAREYFNQLAGKFGRAYCPGRTWEGVAHLLFALVPPMVIADLGAGEGTLSQLLAKRAKKVIAIDNSEKMVEFGADAREEARLQESRVSASAISRIRRSPRAASISRCSARRCITPPARRAPSPPRTASSKRAGASPSSICSRISLKKRASFTPTRWLGFTEAQLHEFLEDAGFRDIEIAVVSRDEQNPQLSDRPRDRCEALTDPAVHRETTRKMQFANGKSVF